MKRRIAWLAMPALFLGAVGSTAALAGREPTLQERAQIEAVLSSHGFVEWGDIEQDGDTWHVDDAEAPDGDEYDLELSAWDYRIIDSDD